MASARSPRTASKSQVPPQGREARALALCDGFVDDAIWRRRGKLALAAKALFKLEVDVPILVATGVSILASDVSVWPDQVSKDWAKRA